MFKRDLEAIIKQYERFPAIAILGPRQSGKTTLAKNMFKSYTYVSLEDPDTRNLALTDPKMFLRAHDNGIGIIIDEFQYAPSLLSYIQLAIDTQQRPSYFILIASQNYLMNQAITQSLAGRIGILTLLPMSIHELNANKLLTADVDEMMFKGGYPRIYDAPLEPQKLYPAYLQTYVERDVRQLVNIGDLNQFQRFLKLCAGRIGQLLNLSELATACGISVSSVQRWISLLEASYTIFLLQPHFTNFNKRLTKSPKLYFYDTGLACSLLEIPSADAITLSPYRGHLFECFIIADLYKQFCNNGQRPPLYFWRDLNGRIEVDCIIQQADTLIPIEIKSGETIAPSFFSSLTAWGELTHTSPENRYVVYGGTLVQQRSQAHVIGWQSIDTFATTRTAQKIKL